MLVDALRIIGTVILGSFVTILFGLTHALPTCIRQLKKLFPKRAPEWYARWDFLILWAVGAAAAYWLFQPRNVYQGFLSGMGCTSALRLGAGKYDESGPNQKRKS